VDKSKYKSVSAQPVKRFFVEMLTRDIQIEDAILDLLDNCVDGILRSKLNQPDSEKPYNGFEARITIKNNLFEIEDNCGGIPWSEHDRAFRMGRPRESDQSVPPKSVGVYGIGMKRAIFKLGKSASILTKNNGDSYQVTFSDKWMTEEDNWDLEVKANEEMVNDGTNITINNLYQDVIDRFKIDAFEGDLIKKIASHYAVIIEKGFKVYLNDKIVEANPIQVRFEDVDNNEVNVVRPYIFKANYDDVDVFLAVGLREPIPGFDRISEEQENVKYSSDYAGWTIICNDRVVLYCDRSELTGWGILGVPRYHTQFIAISGIVEFQGDPSKLPTTTTKRGLKFESSLYQKVLMHMIDGIKRFTDFTNQWKTQEAEAENIVSRVPALPFSQIKVRANNLAFRSVQSGGQKYTPKLPTPANEKTEVRLTYSKPRKDVSLLAEYLFEDEENIKEKDIPRRVGIETFDRVFKQLIEK